MARARVPHTRVSHPGSSRPAWPIVLRACGVTFCAWVVGGGARKETRSRAIKNTGFLPGGGGDGEARNREGIVIFKNFGQNLRAPDGRLGVSLSLTFGASDMVNGADTVRCRMDRSSLAS